MHIINSIQNEITATIAVEVLEKILEVQEIAEVIEMKKMKEIVLAQDLIQIVN